MSKPIVMVKAAISVDGKIATKTGESQWISNEKSRLFVHELRRQYQAILVGVETLIQDNPRLTSRLPGQEDFSPLRIIVDTRGRSPLDAKVYTDAFKEKTLLATTALCPRSTIETLRKRGVEVLVLPLKEGHVDLRALLDWLGQQNIASVFVEGGGEIIASLFKEDLVDELKVAIGPMLIGGKSARSFIAGEGIEHLDEAIHLSQPHVRLIDADVLLEYKVLKKGINHVKSD